MVGDVKWQSRTATEPAQLTVTAQTIQQGERLVSGDNGHAQIDFDSIGTVSMSPNSDLSIIQTLPINFVFLQSSGTVDYTVSGKTPFSIRDNHLIIFVQTGIISVINKKDSSIISIVVAKGTATVAFNNLQYESQRVELKEGDTYVFDDSLRIGSVD